MILNAADRDSRGLDTCHVQIDDGLACEYKWVEQECLTTKSLGAIAVDRFEIGKLEYWAF